MKTNGNWFHNDIVLNVGFAESLKRGLISIMIPLPPLFINHVLLIYAAPQSIHRPYHGNEHQK